jgi:uncharacterized membrane protein
MKMAKTKTMTFAVIHFAIAFSVTYALTGDIVIGGAVALIEPAINTLAFYFHELGWKQLEANKVHLQKAWAETV